jgi:hypothetical protein
VVCLALGCASSRNAEPARTDSVDVAGRDAGRPAVAPDSGTGGSGAALPAAGGSRAPVPEDAGAGVAPSDAGASARTPCDRAACDPEEATCAVVQGMAVCTCSRGYVDVRSNGELCEDVDECRSDSTRCAENARCINTPGSHICKCERGFHGDGVTSCARNLACDPAGGDGQCGAAANCVVVTDEPGTCWCDEGSEGDGRECTPIDECARGLHDCHGLASCTDSERSYSCSCPAGYLGDGHGGSGCYEPESRLTEPRLPPIEGECPSFAPGTSTVPALLGVRLQVGAKPSGATGFLLFYWHATGSHAEEADARLPAAMRSEILDGGGIIAAFESSLGTGGDCSGTTVFARDDFDVADLIAACAVRDHNVDPRRIYVTGCSAGGLQAGCMAFERSAYVAAVATNSGGIIYPEVLTAPRVPAAIAMFGPPIEPLLLDFSGAGRQLTKRLAESGGSAVDCDHGGRHCAAPPELYTAAWQFMKDHPFDVARDPYEAGLPDVFPPYCEKL